MNFSHEFVFPGALKTLLLMASIPLLLSFIAVCRNETVLAADEQSPLPLRTPSHPVRSISVGASGSAEAASTSIRSRRLVLRQGRVIKGPQRVLLLDRNTLRSPDSRREQSVKTSLNHLNLRRKYEEDAAY